MSTKPSPSQAHEDVVRAAMAAYESVVMTPIVTSVKMVPNNVDKHSLSVQLGFKQVIVRTKSTQTSTKEVFITDLDTKDPKVTISPFSTQTDEAGKVSTTSPSRKLTVKFCKANKTKETDAMIELWKDSTLLMIKPAATVHGDVYAQSHTFGGFSWNKCETKLLYVAEPKDKPQGDWWSANPSHEKSGNKFAWKETWGEQHSGVVSPVIYCLDVDQLTSTIAMNEDAMKDSSIGQPRWVPITNDSASETDFVFTAWPHNHRKLGIVYCSNRASEIHRHHLATNACTKLVGDASTTARSPAFTSDGKKLVYLSNGVGGPHNDTSRVMALTFNSDGKVGSNDCCFSQNGSDGIDVDLNLLKFDDCSFNTSDPNVFFATTYRGSETKVVCGNLEKGILIEECTKEGWAGDTNLKDCVPTVLAYTRESPASTPVVHLQSQSSNSTTVLDFSTSFADELEYKVFELGTGQSGLLPYEATLISPKNKTSPPLIVRPHGGPHSNSSLMFDPYNVAFVKMGFAVLTVNYRGSVGFTSAGVKSLLGNVGTLDVNDVNNAVDHVVQLNLVDPEKIGVFGGSHGGFLTGHLTAQFPERYKAAVMRNPVIDISAMMPITDIPDWCYVEAGLEYDTNAEKIVVTAAMLEKMKNASPIAHADAVKAPTMILIGAQDQRVPVSQGFIWHRALQARGVTSQVHVYPDDHHALNGVECAADVFVNTCSWFSQHFK